MRAKHSLFTTITALTALAAPLTAHAAVGLEKVWYPDGVIRWYNRSVLNAQDPGEPLGLHIRVAMEYLAEHTPLDIAEVSSSEAANLVFIWDDFPGDGAGWCPFYWDPNRPTADKEIGFSSEGTIKRAGVLHEVGHALGFPHEFQRADRDSYVNVGPSSSPDLTYAALYPFNLAKMGSPLWLYAHNHLSPYDYGSIMHTGYSAYVTPTQAPATETDVYRGQTTDLSIHDVNGIYRVYADAPGTNQDGDRFGHQVAAGDFDDDGLDDIAVATTHRISSTTYVSIVFYRGVTTDTEESGPDVRYVPWFSHAIGSTSLLQPNTALAAGDFNGDGITDLAVGQPWHNGQRGRVQLLFLNTGPGDTTKAFPKRAPWGRRGVRAVHTILPTDVGTGSAPSSRAASARAWRRAGSPASRRPTTTTI